MSRSLAVIVPVHNELGNLLPFYERARPVLDGLPAIEWRLIFVNDGSTDGSFERIRQMATTDPRVKVISLSRNFGYHAVLLAGLASVDADLYAMIDVDCEDPPELLREFHQATANGADIAYGIRSERIEPRLVTFFRRIFYYVNKGIADSDIVVWMAEFAMITRQVRDAILVPKTTYVFLRAEIGYAGFVRVGLPYVRGRRAFGRTHYDPWQMTRFAVSGFLASSTFPLRFVLYLGAAVALGFPILLWLTGADLLLAAVIASVASLYFVLLALAIIALYLARTYKNGVGRPVFIIDKNKTFL